MCALQGSLTDYMKGNQWLGSVVPYFFKYVPWPGLPSRRPSLPSRGTQACHRTQVHEPKRSSSFYNINTDLKGQWSLSVRCANVMLLLCSDMPAEVSRHWVIWGLWFAETSRVRMSCSRLTWPQWLQTLGGCLLWAWETAWRYTRPGECLKMKPSLWLRFSLSASSYPC